MRSHYLVPGILLATIALAACDDKESTTSPTATACPAAADGTAVTPDIAGVCPAPVVAAKQPDGGTTAEGPVIPTDTTTTTTATATATATGTGVTTVPSSNTPPAPILTTIDPAYDHEVAAGGRIDFHFTVADGNDTTKADIYYKAANASGCDTAGLGGWTAVATNLVPSLGADWDDGATYSHDFNVPAWTPGQSYYFCAVARDGVNPPSYRAAFGKVTYQTTSVHFCYDEYLSSTYMLAYGTNLIVNELASIDASRSVFLHAIDSHASSIGDYCSLALSSTGVVHFSYYKQADGALWHATYAHTTAVPVKTQVTTDAAGRRTVIALDSLDYPHIVFVDDDGLIMEARRMAGGTWTTHTIDTPSSITLQDGFLSMAIDSDDKVNIAFQTGSDDNVKFTKGTGNSWLATEAIGTFGVATNETAYMMTDLALDSDDAAHVAWWNTDGDDMRYATNASGGWAAESVGDPGSGYFPAIGLKSTNAVTFAFGDNIPVSPVMTISGTTGSWDAPVQVADDPGMDAKYLRLGYDSADKMFLMFVDTTDFSGAGNIHLTTNRSGSVVDTKIIGAGDSFDMVIGGVKGRNNRP